jgi:hypothetical protein
MTAADRYFQTGREAAERNHQLPRAYRGRTRLPL